VAKTARFPTLPRASHRGHADRQNGTHRLTQPRYADQAAISAVTVVATRAAAHSLRRFRAGWISTPPYQDDVQQDQAADSRNTSSVAISLAWTRPR
jgi:hypothetical protein